MAIDTRAKRMAMLNWASGPSVHAVLFEADGSVDADDRAHLLKLYGGIALAAVSTVAFVAVSGTSLATPTAASTAFSTPDATSTSFSTPDATSTGINV